MFRRFLLASVAGNFRRFGNIFTRFKNLLEQEETAGNTNVFYDPADLTSLRVNTDGSGGNPAVGDPVGMMLDTSQFGGKTAEDYLASQPEVFPDPNLDSSSNWSLVSATISNGQLTLSPVNAARAESNNINNVFDATKIFEVTVDVESNTGVINFERQVSGSGSGWIQVDKAISGTGLFTFIVSPLANGTGSFRLLRLFGGESVINSISVKEIPGHHAIAPSDSARPVLLDDPDLTAAALTDNGQRGEELVTNGTFDSDVSGWSNQSGGHISYSAGAMRVTPLSGDGLGFGEQGIPTEVGATYQLTVDIVSESSNNKGRFYAGTSASFTNIYDSGNGQAAGSYDVTFVARTTTTYIGFGADHIGVADGNGYAEFDNISVRKVLTAFDERGAELVTNGTFDTDVSGWTVVAGNFASVSGEGVLTYEGSSATVSQQVSVTAGKVYKVTGQIISASSASPRLKVGSSAGATDYAQIQAAGEIDLVFVATSSVISFYVQALAAGNTVVDNISVKEVLYPNLVTNGTFDTDSDWTKGTGWSIGSGVASKVAGTASFLDQDNILEAGKIYKAMVYVSSVTSGNLIYLSSVYDLLSTSTTHDAVGWHTVYIRPLTTTHFRLYANSTFEGSIDNVSVQELPASIDRKYYLDTDGSDDWMQVTPTLNLGEQWWHVGGWQVDAANTRPFATSTDYRGALQSAADNATYEWRDGGGGRVDLINYAPTEPHVVTVEQDSTNSISGRANGANSAGTITPYDDSGAILGLALFSQTNSAYTAGLDGRFYGGAWGQGQVDYDELTVLQDYLGTTTQPPIDPPDVTEYADVYELLSAQTGAVLFDIDDTTSLRVGRDGSGGVPVDGDPVGMMLDVSDTGGATVAAATAARPELVTNGTFDTDTSGWTSQNNATLAVVGGQLTVTGDGTSNPTAYQAITTVANEWYEVVGYHDHNGVFNTGIRIGTTAGGSEIADNLMTADGTYRFLFKATGTTTYVSLRNFTTATNTAVYDNVSVKEISSHAAIAPSDSARPTLASVLDTTASELTDDGTRGEELVHIATVTDQNGATSTIDGTSVRVQGNGSTAFPKVKFACPADIGSTYELSMSWTGNGAAVYLNGGNTEGTLDQSVLSSSTLEATVQATRTTINIIPVAAAADADITFNISVRKVNTVFDERGPELVTNGGFDTDSDWTLQSGVTISGGKAVLTDAPYGNGLTQSFPTTIGATYEVSYEVSELLDNGAGVSLTAFGSYNAINNDITNDKKSVLLIATQSTSSVKVRAGSGTYNTTAKIDNISVKKVLYPNLVTNGTFDTDSDWNKGTDWSIGSGVASASSATGNLQQTGVATANKWYKIQFYISAYTSGTITPNIGGTSGASYNSTGWKSDILRANGTPVNFIASSFTGSIDNIIVQEVPASVARAHYLDFDGADDNLILDADTIAASSNATLYKTFRGDTTDTGQIMFSTINNSSTWILVADSLNSSTSTSANAGSPVFRQDGLIKTYATWSNVFSELIDNTDHTIGVEEADLTVDARWTNDGFAIGGEHGATFDSTGRLYAWAAVDTRLDGRGRDLLENFMIGKKTS